MCRNPFAVLLMPDFIHEIQKNNNANFIVLAAGTNKTRGKHIAKSLEYINRNHKLLDIQINVIKKYFKHANIIFTVGFQSENIIQDIHNKYNDIKIVENKQYKTTTPLESLRLALNCANIDDTYVIYGDKDFDFNCLNFESRDFPTIVEASHDSFSKHTLGLVHQNNKLRTISYGVKEKWGQIFYIPKNLFIDFRQKVNGCKKKYFNIFDVINSITESYKFRIHQSNTTKDLI